MESGTVLLIEPITGLERQELQFGAFGQIRRLVSNLTASVNTGLDGHALRVQPKKAASNNRRDLNGASLKLDLGLIRRDASHFLTPRGPSGQPLADPREKQAVHAPTANSVTA